MKTKALATLAGALLLSLPGLAPAQVNFTSSNGYQVSLWNSPLNGGYPRFGTPNIGYTGSGNNTTFFKYTLMSVLGNYGIGAAVLNVMYDTSNNGTYTGALSGSLTVAVEPVFRLHVKATTPPGVTASGTVIVPVDLHWVEQQEAACYLTNNLTPGLSGAANVSNSPTGTATLFNYSSTYLSPLTSVSGYVSYQGIPSWTGYSNYTDISLRNETVNVSIPATSSTTYEGDGAEFYVPYSGCFACYGMGQSPGGSVASWGTSQNVIEPEVMDVGNVH